MVCKTSHRYIIGYQASHFGDYDTGGEMPPMMRRFVCTALLIVLVQPVLGQGILERSNVEFGTSLEETRSQADQHHRGDHLIFVYPASEKSEELVQRLFADDAVATYINEHFAAMAVRKNSPEGKRVMYTYSGGGAGPRIIISAQRLDGFTVHKTDGDRAAFFDALRTIKAADTLANVRTTME